MAALEGKWRQAEADMDIETKRRVDAEKVGLGLRVVLSLHPFSSHDNLSF